MLREDVLFLFEVLFFAIRSHAFPSGARSGLAQSWNAPNEPYRLTSKVDGLPSEATKSGAREIVPPGRPSSLAPPPRMPAWSRKLAPIIAPTLTAPNLALQFQPWKDFCIHFAYIKHMIPCSFLLRAYETAMTASCPATPLASVLHASHEPPLALDYPNDRDETRP